MTYEEKKSLYESIITEVAKVVKNKINEASSKENSEKKIVVFTGKSRYFKGDDVEKFIKSHTDFKTSHTVDEKTYLIITGEKPGPNKMAKADELNIYVMTEDAFYKKYDLTDELPDPIN